MVLVDEYGKPILDAIEHQEAARTNRDYLRGLYGTIKAGTCTCSNSRWWSCRRRARR